MPVLQAGESGGGAVLGASYLTVPPGTGLTGGRQPIENSPELNRAAPHRRVRGARASALHTDQPFSEEPSRCAPIMAADLAARPMKISDEEMRDAQVTALRPPPPLLICPPSPPPPSPRPPPKRESSPLQLTRGWRQINVAFRDHCAHKLVDLNECRRENFFLPWTCQHEKHSYEKCQYKECVPPAPRAHRCVRLTGLCRRAGTFSDVKRWWSSSRRRPLPLPPPRTADCRADMQYCSIRYPQDFHLLQQPQAEQRGPLGGVPAPPAKGTRTRQHVAKSTTEHRAQRRGSGRGGAAGDAPVSSLDCATPWRSPSPPQSHA